MKIPKRLFWQIFPSYLLITLLSVFAVSWYASKSLRQFYQDQTAIELHARANLLSKLVSYHLTPLDATAVDALCKSMGQSTATRFTIILPSGMVIGDSIETPHQMDNHSDRPEIVKAVAGKIGRSKRYSQTLLEEMMYVAAPLIHNDQFLAVIRASLPITFIDKELKSIQVKLIIGGLIIASLAAGIGLFISRRISRPLEKMKESADMFAGGNLTHRLNVPESVEMASVAEAMNQMAAQLEDRIKSIINQRNEFETVLSSMLEGVIAVNNEACIVSMNQAAGNWFEIEEATYQNRNIQKVIHNIALQRFVTTSLASNKPLQEDIILFKNDERILSVKSSPLLDASQKQFGTLIMFRDVTQLRRLENMRSDFVANVSHEIRTPLTAIKGFVETLRHGKVKKTKEIQRFLGIIQKHVDRLNSIIDDLLTLSRIEHGDQEKPISLQEYKIRDIFQSAVQICRSKADKKKINLDLIDNLGIVTHCDPHLLEQAVINLIDNAIKYSNNEGAIKIKADQMDSEIIIEVQDQGIGIAQNHLPRLFERFYRVDKARSRNLGGTGLGLAIAKHIAQVHGGYITVESILGRGSIFSIHLPISPYRTVTPGSVK
ncbi:MAG: HAMP domain-containing protein [Desulfobacterales bacterium]|nr:HAMP domain-containing protein [Desulfobacterales bacterium]